MTNKDKRPIAITAGEPAGIGPDVLITFLQNPPNLPLRIFADPTLLKERAEILGLPLKLTQNISIESIPLEAPCKAGTLDTRNAPAVISAIEQATKACVEQTCRALVTGPVHKGIINEAGIPFSGHTEFLAELTQTQRTVMLLASDALKVALATTHLPLASVPEAITEKLLTEILNIIHQDFKLRFQTTHPRILVCGLNPHAGEGGHLGKEERDIIEPCLKKLRTQGLVLIGPVSADTAFTPRSLSQCDVVLAMYHDQGLPVLKTLSFGTAVNTTLGLPILRTSVDHGVALDLAGTGKANPDSFNAAIQLAIST